MKADDFFGTGVLCLTDDDIANAANTLACEPAAVRAVCAVETNGGGFLADGRPKILFEAKTFHRLTGGQYDSINANISSAIWDRSLYGAGGAHQYERLSAAMALDESAALQSASWGMFQIMGANFAQCGYASVTSMVEDMVSGAANQLAAFVAFVMADTRMLQAIRGKDWIRLAELYNGPGYADNHYATKLASAYAVAQES